MPGGGFALSGLLVRLRLSVGPASNGAAGRWHQARSCVYAGWRLRLIRPTRPAPTVCRPGKQRRRRAMASGTELRLCRVAAAPYPAYLSGSDCLLARQATAPPGDGIRHGAAFIPDGGCALPGLLVRLRLSVGPASIYPLRYSSRQLSTGQPYPAPAACSCGQGLTSRTRSACRHSGRSLMESV
ncbi:putative receptor [Klebsiella pneumoniae]|nr:putative receptor [Klebsiella pneumoniae]SVO95279.1 putative receptor [Klebsiella pneumoniae]SVS58608.1 putative receptor [Klebsiella pneumoniae]SVT25870.1 putative receptor [Klebsiella pneumoniae]SVT61577.1 putative receptor [Klebsiella pneumoniae]